MQKDNKTHFDRHIQAIRYKLWSINKLPLPQIRTALLELLPLQSPELFIPLMRECLHASKHDRNIGKYLTLFSMLLDEPVFRNILHSCLLEFYPRIVGYLDKQRQGGQIEEAKITRKYWAKRIHPNLYVDLKIKTYRLTNIDVDNLISQEAIESLCQYYIEVMRMPPNELLYYLPQFASLHPAYYHSYSQTPYSSGDRPHPSHLEKSASYANLGDYGNMGKHGNVGNLAYFGQRVIASQPNVVFQSTINNHNSNGLGNHPPPHFTHKSNNSITNKLVADTNKLQPEISSKFADETPSKSAVESVSKCGVELHSKVLVDLPGKYVSLPTNDTNNCLYNTPSQSNFGFAKRQRFESEQTNVGESPQRLRKFRGVQAKHRTLNKNHSNSKVNYSHNQNITLAVSKRSNHSKSPTHSKSSKQHKSPVKATEKQKELPKEQKCKQQKQVIELLKKLQLINQFECNQCGMRFQTKPALEQHIQLEIAAKIEAVNSKQALKLKLVTNPKVTLKSSEEWMNLDSQKHQKWVLKNPVDGKELIFQKNQCGLCGMQIKEKFVDDEWIYEDAVRTVMMQGGRQGKACRKESLMHRVCAKTVRELESICTKLVSVSLKQ